MDAAVLTKMKHLPSIDKGSHLQPAEVTESVSSGEW